MTTLANLFIWLKHFGPWVMVLISIIIVIVVIATAGFFILILWWIFKDKDKKQDAEIKTLRAAKDAAIAELKTLQEQMATQQNALEQASLAMIVDEKTNIKYDAFNTNRKLYDTVQKKITVIQAIHDALEARSLGKVNPEIIREFAGLKTGIEISFGNDPDNPLYPTKFKEVSTVMKAAIENAKGEIKGVVTEDFMRMYRLVNTTFYKNARNVEDIRREKQVALDRFYSSTSKEFEMLKSTEMLDTLILIGVKYVSDRDFLFKLMGFKELGLNFISLSTILKEFNINRDVTPLMTFLEKEVDDLNKFKKNLHNLIESRAADRVVDLIKSTNFIYVYGPFLKSLATYMMGRVVVDKATVQQSVELAFKAAAKVFQVVSDLYNEYLIKLVLFLYYYSDGEATLYIDHVDDRLKQVVTAVRQKLSGKKNDRPSSLLEWLASLFKTGVEAEIEKLPLVRQALEETSKK